jgi:uncharacterized protein (DUF1800 family)
MALSPEPLTTLIAFNRFGFGAKPGGFAEASGDPRGFLVEELKKPDVALIAAANLPPSKQALQEVFEQQEQRKAQRAAAPGASAPGGSPSNTSMQATPPAANGEPGASMTGMAAGETSMGQMADQPAGNGPAPAAPMADGQPMQPPGAGSAPAAPMTEGKPKQQPSVARDLYREEVLARLQKQADAGAGFVERLVAFWSNHFTISVAKGPLIRTSAGAFEREAIRPHVLGRFADMVKAVEQHPAMLFYLDNQRSMGPESKATGKNGKGGLNENLAREIMELHTLGVDGGYTQADVTSLARIITGWTFVGRQGQGGEPGTFLFRPAWHEPGSQTLLGRTYAQPGIAQGEAALADLASHPATAKHIAVKLVRHFVADDPPPALVERLAKTFRDTEGDLAAVSLALLQDDEAWRAPLTKIRNPSEFLTAMNRAVGVMPQDPQPFLGALLAMGMVPWSPPGPNGFPETEAAWASPEAMKVRLDVSWRAAQRIKDTSQPIALLEGVAGAAASQDTREAVGRAESRQQALAILFMSPEFQRR